jgi:uncharacterized protein YkwD
MKYVVFCLLSFILFTQNLLPQSECTGEEIIKRKSCPGDEISNLETELFNLINRYRAEHKLPEIPTSDSVCLIANRHVLDLNKNLGVLTHSWSDCEYDPKDQKTYGCILNAPKKFFPATTDIGFENVYYTSSRRVIPADALEAWKKSPLHNSVILNLNQFRDYPWKEGCVSVEGSFAALWFVSAAAGQSSDIRTMEVRGLGVTFEEAVSGLTDILSINSVSSTVESQKWVGSSSDKTVVLEMFGKNEDIAEGKMALRIRLQNDRTLSPANKQILQTFLRNLAPDWTRRVQWLESALLKLKNAPQQPQTIDYKNIVAELKTETGGYISLTIKPFVKPVPVEFKGDE